MAHNRKVLLRGTMIEGCGQCRLRNGNRQAAEGAQEAGGGGRQERAQRAATGCIAEGGRFSWRVGVGTERYSASCGGIM